MTCHSRHGRTTWCDTRGKTMRLHETRYQLSCMANNMASEGLDLPINDYMVSWSEKFFHIPLESNNLEINNMVLPNSNYENIKSNTISTQSIFYGSWSRAFTEYNPHYFILITNYWFYHIVATCIPYFNYVWELNLLHCIIWETNRYVL